MVTIAGLSTSDRRQVIRIPKAYQFAGVEDAENRQFAMRDGNDVRLDRRLDLALLYSTVTRQWVILPQPVASATVQKEDPP